MNQRRAENSDLPAYELPKAIIDLGRLAEPALVRVQNIAQDETTRVEAGSHAQEVAEGYLYLMRQTFVTGQTLVIDGGGLLV